jgi:hypothetical protein
MQKILIQTTSFRNNSIFDPNVNIFYSHASIYLRDKLRDLGYLFKTADNDSLEDCAWVFFEDAITVKARYFGWQGVIWDTIARLRGKPLFRNLYKECVRAGMQKRMVLFLWETPAVIPQNWNPGLHKLFPIIFTWHDGYIDEKKYFKIHFPQTRQFPEVQKIPFKNRKLLVNISMNKYSRHPRELYSARRASIRYFEKTYPDDFDLYGFGWNQARNKLEKITPFFRNTYPSYQGTIRHKGEVLPKYRFSLCYENIRDEPGWVTEKIFDCMKAGCVPIYWGAPNISEYVDKESFIDRREFKTDVDLAKYIVSITETEYTRFQEAIQEYLTGERFARFLPEAHADVIINALKL